MEIQIPKKGSSARKTKLGSLSSLCMLCRTPRRMSVFSNNSNLEKVRSLARG
ncbi:hypothetical protein HanPSC8_Chr09g0350381 [Helianthus annuus]|nr:hypothetical protein HanPSC8_Chr09g0350381 [Helianthus annuus]